MLNKIVQLKNKMASLLGQRTVGARALVIKENQILLVKHTYMPKWYSIGGAIEKGETPLKAIERELMEEVGIQCLASPQLFGVYLNQFEKRDDYVVLYIVNQFTQTSVKSLEIAEAKWFAIHQLPHDISAATQRRVEEYCQLKKIDDFW